MRNTWCPQANCSKPLELQRRRPFPPFSVSFWEWQDSWSEQNARIDAQKDPKRTSASRADMMEPGHWLTSKPEDTVCTRSFVWSEASAVPEVLTWCDPGVSNRKSIAPMHSEPAEEVPGWHLAIRLARHCNNQVWTEQMPIPAVLWRPDQAADEPNAVAASGRSRFVKCLKCGISCWDFRRIALPDCEQHSLVQQHHSRPMAKRFMAVGTFWRLMAVPKNMHSVLFAFSCSLLDLHQSLTATAHSWSLLMNELHPDGFECACIEMDSHLSVTFLGFFFQLPLLWIKNKKSS